MVKLLKIRMGVADDPTALQPSLNDCLAAMLQNAEELMTDVIQGLVLGATAVGPRRVAAFQQPSTKRVIEQLSRESALVAQTFKTELSRLVYEGGGKEIVQSEMLRFEDLQLFGDAQLDQSIEVARALQEVSMSVDDSLPALDALISTMLGWRTIQPGLNPLRPEVFVRSLQTTLTTHVPESQVREALITPCSGLLGVNLRRLYRELSEWLRSTGVEPAVPTGGRIQKSSGGASSTSSVNDSVAKTLLTLDRLRKLLAGDFDQPKGRADFTHTVPASMALLQDMKQTDALIKRLEERPKPPPPAQPEDMLAAPPPTSAAPARIGQQLGEEVVRLMFDTLGQDARLLPPFQRHLKAMEPAIQRLTEHDSRFFSDRNHPARQLLDRLTQRSLAFKSERDEGWARFMVSVETSTKWLESQVVDADTFDELLDQLQVQWGEQDVNAKLRREDAARALLHAEQRNMLAQRLAQEFAEALEGLEVADFVADFLRTSWSQVVAEAQLSCADGSTDPYGYRALVDDLIWSVQKTSAQRGRTRRLVQLIPSLLSRLREGLQRIGYPPELTQRFFDNLITLHRAAVQEGKDAAAQQAADEAWNQESQFSDSGHDEIQLWLDKNEVRDSGYLGDDALDPQRVAQAAQAELEAIEVRREAQFEAHRQAQALAQRQAAAAQAAQDSPPVVHAAPAPPQPPAAPAPMAPVAAAPAPAPQVQPAPAPVAVPAAAPAAAAAALPAAPLRVEELRPGCWVEIEVKGQWVRAQLTWCSPHATLFMFTSISGDAHSMSRRTLDKLRASGQLKVVADRPVIDEALDQVAQAALKNSLDKK